jgi:ABC-2 type transport system ATP-binding protein
MSINNHNDIALQISDLTKKYGDLAAVDGISLDIHKNEIFGLLGPNGAGKTTTISMICGLLHPTSGAIRFTGYPGKEAKTIIGYCPQENIFYPKLTCMEQLFFIGKMYGIPSADVKNRAEGLLDMLGLKEKSMGQPSVRGNETEA